MGVADHADDLGQDGVRGGLRGAHRQCAFAVDRAGIDFVASFLCDQRTLSGDWRLIDRARALVALERNDEAVATLEKARGNDPANARAWLLSATLSRRLERLGEAREQIAQAALLAPRDPAVGLEAGVIAALSGREQEARRSFESVLLVAPESDEAKRARGYLEQLRS